VTVDNQIFTDNAAGWRDPTNPLSLLLGMAAPRVAYIQSVAERRGLDLSSLRMLDVGCGGGLMAEELARRGASVTGIDPSPASLQVAEAHAKAEGLAIEYRVGRAEALPFEDGSFDLVYCCDVLEHVDNLDRALAQASRMLSPGGVFVYDTINRTPLSWLVVIRLLQEWPKTAVLPPNFHDWKRFIQPDELRNALDRHKLLSREMVGFAPSLSLRALVGLLRHRARGELSYGDLGARVGASLQETESLSVLYGGFALRMK
jgi:2-polyprenyl-6-hydroxyphenyl methylase / 3-demethylubiquinone-9 3-methyltransferase